MSKTDLPPVIDQQGVALPAVRTLNPADPGGIQAFKELLLSGQRFEQTAVDPEEAARAILQQLLDAQSDQELFERGKAIAWRDLTGLPIRLTDYPSWRPSTFEEGSNVFFVVFGERMDTGERVVLTTGAGGVLAQLVNMASRGVLLGAVVKLEKAEKPTSSGYYPLHLELVQPADGSQG